VFSWRSCHHRGITVLSWADVREQGRLAFGGQTPGSSLEAQLVARFEEHPGEMVAVISRLGDKFAAGRVHSPWPIVLRELDQQAPRLRVVADPAADLERRTRLAEAWIRNAGLYSPTEAELVDALFGAHGQLRAWSTHTELRARMVATWQHERRRLEQAGTRAGGGAETRTRGVS
jgi:hypothetical protein